MPACSSLSLNALSGIGGVQTDLYRRPAYPPAWVLMPCRALEAFRLALGPPVAAGLDARVLMPCRALEAFRLSPAGRANPDACMHVLMPCRALEAFRRR